MPITAATATSLAGMPTTGASPYGYAFFDLDANIPGFDRLYVADDRAPPNGGIERWNFDSGLAQCVLSATLVPDIGGTSTAFRGVTGFVSSGTSVRLVAVAASSASANSLVTCVDHGTQNPPGTNLATAPVNTVFRGVALAPR